MTFHEFEGVDGHRIAADIIGEGPPVLLLHGGGQTRGSWRATARQLADRGYRAVTLDARGHGESDWSRVGYDFSVFTGDLLRVIDAVGGRPALIGASLGGLTALVALGEAPAERASALVLVDITPRINPEGADAIRRFMAAHQDGFATVEEAADAVARYMTDRPRPRDVSGLRRNLRERDGRLFWHWDPSFIRPAENSDDYREAWQQRIHDAAAAIGVPTLLVRGEHSKVVDDEGVEQLKAAIPQAEVVEVAGAGHMVAGDANTDFAGAVLEFLARVYPPR